MHWPLAVLRDAVTLCVCIHTGVGPACQWLLVPTVCVCSAAEPHQRSRPHLATTCSNGKCRWHCYVAAAASVSKEGLCLYDIAAQRHQRLTPHLAVADGTRMPTQSDVTIGCARGCHGTGSREREGHRDRVKGWGGSQVRYSKHGESIESSLFSRMERGALCKHPYCLTRAPPFPRRSCWDPLQVLPPGGDASGGRALALSAHQMRDLLKQRAVLSVQ